MLKLTHHKDIICGHGIAKGLGIKIHINLYLIEGLLIDTGPSSLSKQTALFLKNHKINQVALTHIHEDHCGMASWVEKNMGVPIFIHEKSIDEARHNTRLPFYRKIVWGNRKAFQADPMPDKLETENHIFEVIPTPGQHPYHLAFHEKKEGWLFSGDLYVKPKQDVAFLDENISDAINSLKKVLELDFDMVFCSHAGILKDGRKKLKAKLDFFLSLRERVHHLEHDGFSRKEISKKLFPKMGLWEIGSFREWSAYNMVKTV